MAKIFSTPEMNPKLQIVSRKVLPSIHTSFKVTVAGNGKNERIPDHLHCISGFHVTLKMVPL